MAAIVASKIEPTDKPPDAFCKKFDCSFISAHLPISLKELLNATNALQSKNSTDINGYSSSFLKNVIAFIFAFCQDS